MKGITWGGHSQGSLKCCLLYCATCGKFTILVNIADNVFEFWIYVIIAQWKCPSHYCKLSLIWISSCAWLWMQVITKNSNKTTTVLWTPNLPCYTFVRSFMFFSRCVKGCLEQLRWEPYFNINSYWQRLYKQNWFVIPRRWFFARVWTVLSESRRL